MLQVLNANVLIIPDPIEAETTSSGIEVASTQMKPNSSGKVVSVGDKVKDISIGDVVIYSPTHFDEILHEGDEYHVIEERDVYAIIG